MKKVVCLLLILLLLGCAQGAPTEPAASAATEAPVEDGSARMLRFSTTDLDGNPVDESVMDGYDLVMVNFWAYWCGPCAREIPELQKLHESYPNLLLLGVIVDDSDMTETRRILSDANATYPVLYPEGDLAAMASRCQYIPTTFFFRSDGMLLGEPTVGSNDLAGWTAIVKGYLE